MCARMYVLLVACSRTLRACFSILLYLSLAPMSGPLRHELTALKFSVRVPPPH